MCQVTDSTPQILRWLVLRREGERGGKWSGAEEADYLEIR